VYPLPRLEELLHSTGNAKYITTLDLRSGYYQIKMYEPHQDKTAFITPFGVYRFKRMPFGLRNAPATFQRLMDRYKVGIEGTQVLVYLDDLIILSATFSQHLADLKSCFDRMTKCHFGCLEVKYLGHRITPEGIQTNPDKIESILRVPPPINVKQLLTFMQTCNWYRRFIPKLAEIARPLTSLTKKDAAWDWGSSPDSSQNDCMICFYQHISTLHTIIGLPKQIYALRCSNM
jgi:hypothetical protein